MWSELYHALEGMFKDVDVSRDIVHDYRNNATTTSGSGGETKADVEMTANAEEGFEEDASKKSTHKMTSTEEEEREEDSLVEALPPKPPITNRETFCEYLNRWILALVGETRRRLTAGMQSLRRFRIVLFRKTHRKTVSLATFHVHVRFESQIFEWNERISGLFSPSRSHLGIQRRRRRRRRRRKKTTTKTVHVQRVEKKNKHPRRGVETYVAILIRWQIPGVIKKPDEQRYRRGERRVHVQL